MRLYQGQFAEKLRQAGPRIDFNWRSLADFMESWKVQAKQFKKDIIVIDEGDQVLVREVANIETFSLPKRWVLLSALPRDRWTDQQELCFSRAKNRAGHYIDATSVFPSHGAQSEKCKPSILPSDFEQIVKFAIQKSKECAVLLWASSSKLQSSAAWSK